MKFDPQFLQELRQNDPQIICLVSGGYDSSVTALLLKDYGFDNVILLNNRTYLEEPFSLAIMFKVAEITGYKLIRAKPDLKQRPGMILRESFEQKTVEFIAGDMGIRNTYRDKTLCCRKLKKTPAKKYYKNHYTAKSRKHIIISSIKPSEGGPFGNRWRRLKELRDLGTFTRYQKTKGVYYAYPWRDYTKKSRERDFYYYLNSKGIMPEHSGCICCPIRVARMIKRNDFWNCADLRLYCKVNNLDITEFIGTGIQLKIERFV